MPSSGRHIGIRVAVIGAHSTPTDPVFFISGGPGASTISEFARAATLFPGLTQRHDVVLVDQRGTGASHALVLPARLPGQDLAEYARAALAMMDGDPRFYTTVVAMDDLDAVRDAMGYRSIDLYGLSYGAIAAQYYLRQHKDRVHAAVLDSGSLLDVPAFEVTAPNSQRALDDLFRRCASDSACAAAHPHPAAELTSVLDQLARAPVTTVGLTAPSVVVTADVLANLVHGMLQQADSAADVPWLIHRAAAGDFESVAKILSDESGPQLASLAMNWEILCSEAWAGHDPARVKALGAGSYYGPAMLAWTLQLAAVCPLLPMGVVPAGDDQPARTKAPVLLLNGQEDPAAAPHGVAAAGEYMPNSLSVVVPGQGHGVGFLSCMPSVVVDFLDAGRPDQTGAHRCAARVPATAIRVT